MDHLAAARDTLKKTNLAMPFEIQSPRVYGRMSQHGLLLILIAVGGRGAIAKVVVVSVIVVILQWLNLIIDMLDLY